MENEQNVESVFLSSEERFEPVTSEPIVTDMEVHFIDVGQADAALVLYGGGKVVKAKDKPRNTSSIHRRFCTNIY